MTSTLLMAGGALLALAGLWWMHPPLALLFGGAFLLSYGWLRMLEESAEKDRKGERKE